MGKLIPPDNILQQVFSSDITNIVRTVNRLKDKPIHHILDEIEGAQPLMVIGSGLSAAPALFLAY